MPGGQYLAKVMTCTLQLARRVLCDFLEKGGRAACDGGKGVNRAECSGMVPRRCAGNGINSEGMCAAAECAAQLRIGRALLAGRGMRRLFVLLRLFGKDVAECMHGRALLCKQQGEGEHQGEQKACGLHGGGNLNKERKMLQGAQDMRYFMQRADHPRMLTSRKPELRSLLGSATHFAACPTE